MLCQIAIIFRCTRNEILFVIDKHQSVPLISSIIYVCHTHKLSVNCKNRLLEYERVSLKSADKVCSLNVNLLIWQTSKSFPKS